MTLGGPAILPGSPPFKDDAHMKPHYFVSWEGDTKSDPLNKGVEEFPDVKLADEFCQVQKNKGHVIRLYEGYDMFWKHTKDWPIK
jgi:hypothetical protein